MESASTASIATSLLGTASLAGPSTALPQLTDWTKFGCMSILDCAPSYHDCAPNPESHLLSCNCHATRPAYGNTLCTIVRARNGPSRTKTPPQRARLPCPPVSKQSWRSFSFSFSSRSLPTLAFWKQLLLYSRRPRRYILFVNHEFGILHRELEEQGALVFASLIRTFLLGRKELRGVFRHWKTERIGSRQSVLRYIDSGSRQL